MVFRGLLSLLGKLLLVCDSILNRGRVDLLTLVELDVVKVTLLEFFGVVRFDCAVVRHLAHIFVANSRLLLFFAKVVMSDLPAVVHGVIDKFKVLLRRLEKRASVRLSGVNRLVFLPCDFGRELILNFLNWVL